jgi:hypothetical protein
MREMMLHSYCYEPVVQGMDYSHIIMVAAKIDVDEEGMISPSSGVMAAENCGIILRKFSGYL